MSTEFPNETALRQYLLGTLPEAEWELIEKQLLHDNAFGNTIDVAEDEIIEDYLDGNLSFAEQRAVENHFLCPPERQRKLWFARLLRSQLQAQKKTTVEPPSIPWVRRPAFTWAASLAAAVLFVAVLGLGVYTANQHRLLEAEHAEHQMTQATLEQERKHIARLEGQLALLQEQKSDEQAVSVNPSAVLDLKEVNRSDPSLPELNDNLEIRMALTHGILSSYRATLQRSSGGSPIWTKANLKPAKGQLVLRIPRSLISPGEYSVIIQGEGDPHSSTYPFRVR
jgi:hypothetical protein